MSFDEKLAGRVRAELAAEDGVSEKKMFGGLCFLHQGRMFAGLAGDDLMVRVGPARYGEALARPHARPMDFTGKPFVGYVFVAPAGCRTQAALAKWVVWALEHVRTLPPAKRKPRKPRRPRPGRERRP